MLDPSLFRQGPSSSKSHPPLMWVLLVLWVYSRVKRVGMSSSMTHCSVHACWSSAWKIHLKQPVYCSRELFWCDLTGCTATQVSQYCADHLIFIKKNSCTTWQDTSGIDTERVEQEWQKKCGRSTTPSEMNLTTFHISLLVINIYRYLQIDFNTQIFIPVLRKSLGGVLIHVAFL